ncbi:hydrophobic/amphiphilic exporter-1 (mainly G- bacteria), HAE1 family [Staphylococcus epidermidis]|uniref:efflux RND transporter permease subunit n=1 Tax=Staphylococcus epidermidis TaxID=1282 RepID=UPI00026C1522|nr:efflux RND transporter permease subunit [Staphylococcus epidermidis]EJD98202.1 AcrB/AcrD/AcrF family protein [Staphylococcus epidermidis NIHLM040]KTF25550.1 multidrug transporter [Staphylococcus epidermidis FS1]MBC2966576.1 efflux RND transporter permease subunit [Staphylococcus epidermidis]MBC3110797.1 efflux RND transporter permease subunit [Staphylococcus epidermidis]MBM0786793.1 efflux RND transporter permease subunit [Staphylococcus epidermidis]
MIKKLLQFSLGNKFAIFLMVVLIILGGVYSSAKLKLELLPDVENPVISVQTTMSGATPQSTQEEISSKIENQVRSLAYVNSVQTESIPNASIVTVEYDNGTDMDKAEEQLKKEIDKIKFKDGVGEPELTRNSMDAFPIVAYSFTSNNQKLKDVTKKLNQQLVPKLQTIDGVQNAQLNGQTNREVSLKFKQKNLDEKGLTANDVENYIKTATRETPLGLFQFNKSNKSIVVDGQFKSVDAFKNLKIPLSISGQAVQNDSDPDSDSLMPSDNTRSTNSSTHMAQEGQMPSVPLKDLADISVGDERTSISKTNGKDAVNLQIMKSQDANTVQVAREVQKKVDEFVRNESGMKSIKTMDTAKPIEDSLYTMVEKAALGTIVAIIVILLFLRNIRTTAISIVSIPMSILIALIALKLSNVSLNILTLGALTVAIGRVIDDSIVVVENIFRRLSDPNEKLKGENLIISATREVFKPIMSSTLVTIVVFLPLVFVSGSVGEMFRPFALAITFSLLASLLVSITLVPSLGATFFKNGVKNKEQKEGLGTVGRAYRSALNWSLNHKWIVLIVSIFILVGSVVIGARNLGTSYISTGDNKFLALTYTPKPGETQKSVTQHAEKVQNYLDKKDKVETVQYSIGGPTPQDPTGSTNSMAIMIKYQSDTPNFDEEPDKVLKHIETFKQPGEWKNQDLGTGAGNNSVEVTVKGPNTSAMKDTVNRVEKMMTDIKGITNVKSDLSQTYDQYEIKVDQNKAADNGISAAQLAMNLNENLPEKTISTVNEKGKSIDVKVKQNKQTDWSSQKIKNIKLNKPTGGTIKLSEIASLKKSYTPSKLIQEDGDYATTVTGKVTDKDVGGKSQQVMAKVKDLEKPSHIKINVGGATDDIDKAISQLAMAMIAAIIIVYLILVITFRGGLAPFTILFSLPFTVIGVVLALIITGETISVPSLIGMLMLIGIVVTNAIVLIDRVINNEKQGMTMKQALIEAGGTRIRPILMTAIATIGALVPLLFGQDSSILISKGMAATVIGGLISSTLLTLFVVPVIYEILFTLKNKITKKFNM